MNRTMTSSRGTSVWRWRSGQVVYPMIAALWGVFEGATVSSPAATTPAVAAGRYHSMAVTTTGIVWAWGRNDDAGQLGDGTTTTRSRPVQVTNLSGVAMICAGAAHNLVAQTNGTARAWGSNTYGELGTNGSSRPAPILVPGLNGVVAVAVGDFHSLAVESDGTVWAWGNNGSGGLGDGTTANRSSAGRVASLSGAMDVAAGYAHSLAVKSNGTVWAWGDNAYGEPGDGTTSNRFTPVPTASLTGVMAVAAGESHSLALKSDGTVWAWGYNWSGQLGDGSFVTRSTPVQVTNLSGGVAIAGGAVGNFSLALKSDGTVWAWGGNGYGQLGDGTATGRSRPVQVTNLSGVVAIAAGMRHSLVLKGDGTVWAWGNNGHSQLGNGTTVDSRTPVQVSNLNVGSSGPSTGALTVTLTPAGAVSAGALWNVDGGTWTNSGATNSGLSVGSHTVNFNAVGGWTAPAGLTVTIGGGATTTATGTYTAVSVTRIIGVSGSLAFGSVTTGATATATLTIANSGNSTLTVSGIGYPDGFSGAWSGAVAAGGSHNVTVTFAPAAVAAYTGTVTVVSDATDGTGTLAASGTGVAAGSTAGYTFTTLAGLATVSGTNDGTGSEAQFDGPDGVAVDGAGNVYVADYGNHTIRKVSAAGVVTTIGGLAMVSGTNNGTGSAARFNQPCNVAVDSAGNVYVADQSNHTIRKGVPPGTTTTKIIGLSGNLAFGSVTTGATATATLTIANSGNATLTVGSIGYPGGFSGAWSGAIAAGGSHNVTVTFAPTAVAVYTGTVTVVSDATGGIATLAASGTGVAAGSAEAYTFTTLAGLATVSGTNNGTGSAARFNDPSDAAVDSEGNVYVADEGNNRIRKVTAAGGGDAGGVSASSWRRTGQRRQRVRGGMAGPQNSEDDGGGGWRRWRAAQGIPAAPMERAAKRGLTIPRAWRWMARAMCSWRTRATTQFER